MYNRLLPGLRALSFQKAAWAALLLTFILSSCATRKPMEGMPSGATGKISCTILQINDFYEIAPLDQGRVGGAARIATLYKKLKSENPNTLCMLAGDFLSPSLIGTLKWDGERIRGKQMVEALNTVGVDLVAFGNHEFDLDEVSLLKRINESKFDWVATNVLHKTKEGNVPFQKNVHGVVQDIPKSKILEIHNSSGKKIKLGVVSPCLPANKAGYVFYEEVRSSVQNELQKLEGKADFIIMLSHLTKEEDLELAKSFPAINLILGGHEHEHMKYEIGATVMTKADANAKSAYVHRIEYDLGKKKAKIRSSLVPLNESIALDPETKLVVEKWKNIESKIMREMGFDPGEQLLVLHEPYDARELTIRNVQCPFGNMIARAMSKAYPSSDCSLHNSGGVRVDDMLQEKLSQYDILRSLPYGGAVFQVKMKGSLLQKILEAGVANKGSGGYLQWDRIAQGKDGKWFISQQPLDPDQNYKVAINDFLLTGAEKGMDYLKQDNPFISEVMKPSEGNMNDMRWDIRKVIIDYLKKGGR